MRRNLVILLLAALVVGMIAPAEAAKKKKKPPAKPVPVDVVYNVVSGGEATCALSIATGEPASCGDPFGGGITGAAGQAAGPIPIAAVDGLPLTLDASKPIKGKFVMRSYGLAAVPQAPLGAGEAEVTFVLTAIAGGEDLTLGEATTSYLVSPASRTYDVEFEIAPAAELTGKVLDSLTLSYEVTGPAVLHGGLSDDGNTLTLGAFAVPK